jgi:hypothetical protein
MRNIPVTAVTEKTRAPGRTSALLLLRFFVSLSVAALIAVSPVSSAQRRTAFDGQMEYQLTVEKQPAQSVGAWWPAFVAQNTLEGYCWNLNTLPLADRPQLGDKAKILRVGGAGGGRSLSPIRESLP